MLLNDGDTWFVSGYNGGNLFFSHGVIGGLEGYVLRRQAGLVARAKRSLLFIKSPTASFIRGQ